MRRTLDSRFKPLKGSGFGLRLLLTPDAVELRRFGVVVRRVPIEGITDVYVARNSESSRNLSLGVHDGDDIVGHVESVSLWKFALRDRLGLDLLETAPARKPLSPRRAA